MLFLGVAVCLVLLIAGVPLFIAFAIGGLIIIMLQFGLPLYNLSVFFFDPINSFLLLAVPLFTLAGQLMQESGMGKSLVDFVGSFIGRVPGGIAVTAIVASTVVGALTGSNLAVLTSMGSVLFPAMVSAKYEKGYAGAVLCSSCQIGFLIPPSVPFIIYGFMTNSSVPKLFIAGIIPGILLAALLGITAVIIAKRRGYPSLQRVNPKERKTMFLKALPAIIMPIIVLGGIYSGIFTPTEAAAVACVYTLLVGAFVYRELNLKNIWSSVIQSTQLTCVILVLFCGIMVLSKAFMTAGIPRLLGEWVIESGLNQTLFLAMLCVVFALLGVIMDAFAAVAILPLVVSSAANLGINPIHLGVLFVVGSAIGTMTPPVAGALYLTSTVFNIPSTELMKEIVPFLTVTILLIFLLALFPEISLWLPSTMVS